MNRKKLEMRMNKDGKNENSFQIEQLVLSSLTWYFFGNGLLWNWSLAATQDYFECRFLWAYFIKYNLPGLEFSKLFHVLYLCSRKHKTSCLFSGLRTQSMLGRRPLCTCWSSMP